MKTVLIVEDNQNDRKLLRLILERKGLTVLEAGDGQQALELLATRTPDLIVSDALMPVMDGFQFLKKLQEDERLRDIPFVYYSASYTGQTEVALGRNLGARAFLVKPKEPEELWQALQAAANGSSAPPVEKQPKVDETRFLQDYTKIVVAKLEEKVAELETLNRSLEERVAAAVAELKAHEEKLIQQNRLAAMGELLDNISHQWRNPLNTIGLFVQEMQMDCKSRSVDYAKVEEDADRIMQTLAYLSTTIEDFHRALHAVPHREKFFVRELVERTLDLVAPLNNGIGVLLTVESDAQVNADPYYYSQVLMNVLANARDSLVKVTDRQRRIEVEIKSESGKSVLIVRDNGGGISPKVLPQVFEPYFTTKFQGRGTGISLYMSKMIIENQMGGSITLRNAEEGVEVRIEV
jgi:signal transduction histidine kinase